MARIELRDCTIRLKDGFSGAAVINDTVLNLATTVVIDGVASLSNGLTTVPVGARFTVNGHAPVWTVTAVNPNEQQTVTVTATGGTFTLTYAGQTTGALAENLSAALVQAALEGLSTIGAGNVSVTGGAGGPYLVEFQGTLASADLATMTASGAALTPAATVSVIETYKGDANGNEQQTVTVADASGGHFHLIYSGNASAVIPFGANGATVQTALEGIAGIGVNQVTVVGDSPYLVEFTGTMALTDIDMLTTDATAIVKTSVISVAETHPGGTTWKLTFTPAMLTADLPANNDVITFQAQQIDIKIGEGNLTYKESKAYDYLLDRGDLDTVREGDEQPLEVDLEFVYEFVTTGTTETITPVDALKRIGAASGWVSTSSDQCEPYAIDIEIAHVPPCGTAQDETTVLPDFRYESLDFDLSAATIATSGKCNASSASVARS